MMLLSGLTLLVFWLSEFLFLVLCIGLFMVGILECVVFLMLSYSFCMNFGLERDRFSGIDIWRSCRFIGAMMRSLCLLPGGLGRFVPCSIGANHCRLRHLGWERCSHGLTSRPRESALFWINFCSCFSILQGLLVRCLLGLFLFGTVLLGLLVEFLFGLYQFGHVAWMITVEDQAALVGKAEVAGRASGFGRRRFRLNRKTPAHLVGHCMHPRPFVWKRLHCFGYPGVSDVDCKRRRCNQHGDDGSLVHPRTGVG